MEKKRKYFVIISCIIILLIATLCIISKILNVDLQEQIENENLDQIMDTNFANLSDFNLVTYAQSANYNSFIKSITVNASNDGKVEFAIGSMNSDGIAQIEKTFEIECKKGENQIDLIEERYMIKKGQYLFMNTAGENILENQEDLDTKTFVQKIENQNENQVKMVESHAILPFQYSLEKVTEYHSFVIGNNITIYNNSTGLNATSEEYDYYNLTKVRLQNEFENLTMNRINAMDWEKNQTGTRKTWLDENLKEMNLTNLDLVIFQLGDNFNETDDFETAIREMVNYMREYSPNAEMIWIGLWDVNEKRLNQLPGICERLNIQFMNISDLVQPEYQSLIMQNTENAEKTDIEVYYPNNEAMQIISNRIMEVLKFDF